MRIGKKLNSNFFYKVFAFITVIILVSSLTISLLIYYRFYTTLSQQNRDLMVYTGNQVKSNILNLTRKCELIAGNIYSDNTIELFLKANYYKDMDYRLFEIFNIISSSFQAIEENNEEISNIRIYKLDPSLITNGKEVRDANEFERQDLIKKAIAARGSNVWAAYAGKDGKLKFSLLKYLNVYKPGGILVIELKEESFFNLYKSGIGDKNNLFIIDESHNIISSNQRGSIGSNISTLLKGYLPESISTKEVLQDNISYFFYTDKINDVWSLVMLYNAYEIEKEKRYMTYYVLILTSVFIMIGLLFSLFLASRFAFQVDKLMAKIKEIQKGNLKIQPDIKQVNEFHQLDKTLCTMAQSIESLNAGILKAVKQKEESEIKYLQMQMNPHFLYNLLSVIRWIAYSNNQTKIINIVDNLSSFYKIALSKGNEIIDINSEVSLIKSYIELQNLCLDGQINLNISIDERLSDIKISKMTLQPFIENSVVHGRVGGRKLNILVDITQTDAGEIKIRIEDDGAGITDEVVQYIESLNEKGLAIEGKHYGITNTIARLNLLYGGGVTIHAARKGPGTLIELTIRLTKP